MSKSSGALQTGGLIQDENETDKRTSNRRILLTIERSKPTCEDIKLCMSIPANTISLPPEAFYSQKITPAHLVCLCSNAVVGMMVQHSFHSIVSYIDGFFIVGKTKAECQQGLLALIKLLHSISFYVSFKKVLSAYQHLTFLGIELHSTTMSLRLLSDKLDCLNSLMVSFSTKISAFKC